MPPDIVDALLEDQVDLPPQFGIQLEIAAGFADGPVQLHIPGGEDVRGKAAHTLSQIAEVVLVRLDGPHDVADVIQELAGERADALDRLAGYASGRALVGHFAEDGDLRKAGSDVVVQIGGDAHANALDFEQPGHPDRKSTR